MSEDAIYFEDEALSIIADAILRSKSDSFVELVELAGLRPDVDFVGADLRGADFRSQDLGPFNFTGADLRGCEMEGALLPERVSGAWLDSHLGEATPEELDRAAEMIEGALSAPRVTQRLTYFIGYLATKPSADASIFAASRLAALEHTYKGRRVLGRAIGLLADRGGVEPTLAIQIVISEMLSLSYPFGRERAIRDLKSVAHLSAVAWSLRDVRNRSKSHKIIAAVDSLLGDE